MMNTYDKGDRPGILSITELPNSDFGKFWDTIYLDESFRANLLAQAILNYTVRQKISSSVVPLHGLMILVGLPGTGKTSFAKGLANEVATVLGGKNFQFIEIEPHGLTSSAAGKTQREVKKLFADTIPELSEGKYTIVLLDEVDTIATARTKMGLDANPIDLHRATDAILVQLDHIAVSNPNILFLATSNFPELIDEAFISRADFVSEFPIPPKAVCQKILEDCLSGLGDYYPKIKSILGHKKFKDCISKFVGLDGRTIRKTVLNALAIEKNIALDPNKLEIEHLFSAAELAKNKLKLKE